MAGRVLVVGWDATFAGPGLLFASPVVALAASVFGEEDGEVDEADRADVRVDRYSGRDVLHGVRLGGRAVTTGRTSRFPKD